MKILIIYKRSLFTTPSSTKISTSPTQNEINLKRSEIECAKKKKKKKKSKATLPNHLNLTLSFFKQSSVAPLRGI